MNPSISILIATFNEQDTIEACLRRVCAVYGDDAEVLVIDGGNDNTRGVVERLGKELASIRYVRNENDRGKGHAIRTGMKQAKGNVLAQIDADLQFIPEELPALIDPILRDKVDVTLGSRFAKRSFRRPGSTPFFRTLGNKMASTYASLLFGHRMTDVQAGFKAWKKTAVRPADLRSDNYSYEVEIPIRALQNGLRVMDVAITTDARQGGETCVNVVTDGLKLLRDISWFKTGWK